MAETPNNNDVLHRISDEEWSKAIVSPLGQRVMAALQGREASARLIFNFGFMAGGAAAGKLAQLLQDELQVEKAKALAELQEPEKPE